MTKAKTPMNRPARAKAPAAPVTATAAPQPAPKIAEKLPEPAPVAVAKVEAAPAVPVVAKTPELVEPVAPSAQVSPTPAAPAAPSKPTKTRNWMTFASSEESTMTTFPTFDFTAPFQTAFADLQEKTKAAYEKGTSAYGDYNDFAKGNVEAMVEAGKILASGLPASLASRLAKGH